VSADRTDSMKKKDEMAALCAEIVQRIKTEEDPTVLNEYRSYVKKNVPFFLRSYFAAFLLKQLIGEAPRDARKGQGERRRRSERAAAPAPAPTPSSSPASAPLREEAPPRREDPAPRRALPESEAATLFVGVGRNRRAYARELLSLIVANAGIDADAIGELRVLDNFSFVQIKREVADAVIERLNGFEFRGRAISVSYAKPRKEEAAPAEAESAVEAVAESAPEEAPADESETPAEE